MLQQLLVLNEQIEEVKLEQQKYGVNRLLLPTIGGSVAGDLDGSSDNEAYTPYSCLSTSELPLTPYTALTTADGMLTSLRLNTFIHLTTCSLKFHTFISAHVLSLFIHMKRHSIQSLD